MLCNCWTCRAFASSVRRAVTSSVSCGNVTDSWKIGFVELRTILLLKKRTSSWAGGSLHGTCLNDKQVYKRAPWQ